MTIDLRSDTLTKPTPEMLDAMYSAEVGDDVFGEDPTVSKLESILADKLGMETGLFCPSGTMTNQIAIRILTRPQDEIICDQKSHIYNYEGGGIAYNSFCSVRMVDAPWGIMQPSDVVENINPDDIHKPVTRLVALENTFNKGGGSCYSLEQISEISRTARDHGLKLHLDGARLFNALLATGDQAVLYGPQFDTISVSLSKGLGAPVGSVLLGSRELIKQGRRIRKVLGGGMRQSGYLAAAGIYALENNMERLADDHHRARVLGETLSGLPFVKSVAPIHTNIVIFEVPPELRVQRVLDQMDQKGLKAVPFGGPEIRFVTHLGFDDNQLEEAVTILRKLSI